MLSEDKRIKTRQQLKEFLEADLAPYQLKGRQYLAYIFQISERAILRRHIILLRKTEYHTNTGHRLRSAWYLMHLRMLQNKYALRIGVNCCEKGFRILHLNPVCVTDVSAVGENCRLHMDAYLVGNGSSEGAKIGNNVIIGCGAKIVGDVTLADNITVGAGAVVTKSFLEPGITIAGVPAKKISDGRTVF